MEVKFHLSLVLFSRRVWIAGYFRMRSNCIVVLLYPKVFVSVRDNDCVSCIGKFLVIMRCNNLKLMREDPNNK